RHAVGAVVVELPEVHARRVGGTDRLGDEAVDRTRPVIDAGSILSIVGHGARARHPIRDRPLEPEGSVRVLSVERVDALDAGPGGGIDHRIEVGGTMGRYM